MFDQKRGGDGTVGEDACSPQKRPRDSPDNAVEVKLETIEPTLAGDSVSIMEVMETFLSTAFTDNSPLPVVDV